jgi:hypothetical protein
MYSAFVGVLAPGQDGMRYALFPINNAALEGLFPDAGFESAGFDRCAISFFRQQTWREIITLSAAAVAGL